MNTFAHVPPGFRFHPTDEELVDYYLRKKVASKRIDLDVIRDVDLYKIEPWDLQELCKLGTEDQNEWYFFSHKDKKYPTGTRTNRATKAGFWKATGRDKAIYSRHSLVGMRKTLVFYKGRAPNGQKSDWIMHEYRLETNENGTPQEEGWVVCRVFKKRLPTMRKLGEFDSPCSWYDDQLSFLPEFNTPLHHHHHHPHFPSCKQEPEFPYNIPQDPFLQLPHLESPKIPHTTLQSSTLTQEEQQMHQSRHHHNLNSSALYIDQAVDQVTDWRVLDKFVASQLLHGHEHSAKETAAYSDVSAAAATFDMNGLGNEEKRPEPEYASTSTSSCQIDLWK